MPPFYKILVAVDFSKSSLEAFKVACTLARGDHSRMLLLHVAELEFVAKGPVYRSQRHSPFVQVERDANYYAILNKRLREFYVPDHALEVSYRTVDGQPAVEILHASKLLKCDLIVMGTHGRTGFDRLRCGSVAEEVMRAAHCPVLALRSIGVATTALAEGEQMPAGAAGDAGADQEWIPESIPDAEARLPIRCILHPTDLSPASDAALEVARSLARDEGAELILLHVISIEAVPSEVPPLPVDRAAFHTALESRRARAEGPDLKRPVRTMLREGDVVDETLRTAVECGCDLMVIGTHGRTGIGRLLVGSVAETVLRRSPCAVLAVKPEHPIVMSRESEASLEAVRS
jgi:nucleotide-binding universal stress UspA family protein